MKIGSTAANPAEQGIIERAYPGLGAFAIAFICAMFPKTAEEGDCKHQGEFRDA